MVNESLSQRRKEEMRPRRTAAPPLYDLPYETLCPGSAALDELMRELE